MLEWFRHNADAVQSITAIISAALSLITIWVLIKTKQAAEAQAKAARALTEVSEQQRIAAEGSAAMAAAANELEKKRLEAQEVPILILIMEPVPGQPTVRFFAQNQGPGTAYDVTWQYQTENQVGRITNTLIGSGYRAEVSVMIHELNRRPVVISYASSGGKRYTTKVEKDLSSQSLIQIQEIDDRAKPPGW